MDLQAGWFRNGDDCGDWVLAYGKAPIGDSPTGYFQLVNTISNAFFLIAGALLVQRQSSEARQSGALLVAVGIFSGCYHATSRWGGFLVDITAMSLWGGHLVYSAQRLRRTLGRASERTGAGPGEVMAEAKADFQAFVAAGGAAMASVLSVWLAGDVLGLDPLQVWYIWSTAFVLLVLGFALPALEALFHARLLSVVSRSVAAAIALILLGVCFTQLCFHVCAPGLFTRFPFHTGWHACSSTSAYFCGVVLDVSILGATERLQKTRR